MTHGYLMADEYPPFCEDCLVPLTVRHILVECPSLGELRAQHLSESRDRDGAYILAKILGADVNDKSGIFRFIAEADLLQHI